MKMGGPDLEQQASARMPCDVKSDVVVARSWRFMGNCTWVITPVIWFK